MSNNEERLNEKESDWVVGIMMRITTGKCYKKKCPSKAAWDRVQANMTEVGLQDKNVPYKS